MRGHRFRTEFTAVGAICSISTALREFPEGFPKDCHRWQRASAAIARRRNCNARGCRTSGVHRLCLSCGSVGFVIVSARVGRRLVGFATGASGDRAARPDRAGFGQAAFMLLRQRYDGHWPSSLCLIQWSQPHGDIEKILVMGAHGPKEWRLFRWLMWQRLSTVFPDSAQELGSITSFEGVPDRTVGVCHWTRRSGWRGRWMPAVGAASTSVSGGQTSKGYAHRKCHDRFAVCSALRTATVGRFNHRERR